MKEESIWYGFYISIFYFISISIGSFLFLTIQNVSKSGWSTIIHPIMEEISHFIPYGFTMIFFIHMLCITNNIHMFHWMDPFVYDITSSKYDEMIASKRIFLNKPFFIIRNIIYIIIINFFYFQITRLSKKMNISFSIKKYNKIFFMSVLFIILFSVISIFMSWDWIMSLNPHWFSSLFEWYVLSHFLTTGIGMIIIVSLYLNKKGFFPLFNNNHLHDLSKYLFSSNLLWTYLWFSQFVLYWYGNIPEEIYYFIKREKLYYFIHFWILIPNFIIPFFLLMSKKNKINSKIVFTVSFITLIGHYIDIYHLIAPDINHKINFWIQDIGFFLLIGGIFIYILVLNLEKKRYCQYPIGNPFFKESKNYKNPHI
ncbi:hypothetical protein [Blattabacterium cuenoti]|uniref:hypothetical protein n=1 Tax=Blattabacterium cuenoti TaxID=1653831 RepID=UPI001EEB7FB7|nr:hypothetical protein [Blattabacterium cuenoti]